MRMWIVGLGAMALAALLAALPALIGYHYLAVGEAALAGEPGNASLAAGAFQQALKWSPANPAIYRALAQSSLRLNQYQAAVEALEQAHRLQPDSLLIRQELAQAYEAAGEPGRADALWAALGLSERELLDLGEQSRRAKRYGEALAWYERAGRAGPDTAAPLYYAGLVYRDQQQLDAAIATWRRAAKLSARDRDVWYELGKAYAERAQWGAALDAYQQGLKADSGAVGPSVLYYQLGFLRQHQLAPPDPSGAWQAYQQALAADDFAGQRVLKAETYYQRGNLLVAQQQWWAAVPEFRLALELRPDHYWVQTALGDALWHTGQRDAAYESLRKAIAIEPKRKNAYRLLGDFYRSDGKLADARAMYATVVALDPQDRAARDLLDALP